MTDLDARLRAVERAVADLQDALRPTGGDTPRRPRTTSSGR
ncbi:hypothetical protein [Pseudonocardia sp. ICBG601]|nr:hypothetical protein [Pseudonocardia sp. ICBG601]